jgi:hypothetical protein
VTQQVGKIARVKGDGPGRLRGVVTSFQGLPFDASPSCTARPLEEGFSGLQGCYSLFAKGLDGGPVWQKDLTS